MSEPLIVIDNLSIGYNNQPILSVISLSIDCSSFTALLGANGSGKSTLLETLLGLEAPISGQIRFQAKNDIPLVFGYVPQSSQLDPLYPFTGFDVALMGFFGRVGPGRRVSRAERSFVRECLRVSVAEEFSHKP